MTTIVSWFVTDVVNHAKIAQLLRRWRLQAMFGNATVGPPDADDGSFCFVLVA